jgi:hypothetical protein
MYVNRKFNFKFQPPGSREIPSAKLQAALHAAIGDWGIDVSPELGAWNLELSQCCPHGGLALLFRHDFGNRQKTEGVLAAAPAAARERCS